MLSAKGVSTDPSKVVDVQKWARPSNVKDVRSFLGLASYYRRFVKNFGVLAKPLTDLLKKGVQFVWKESAEQAFQLFKQSLISAPVLALPDFSKPFVIETNASDTGIGAVLQQEGHPIAFVSKALGPKNQGLSTYEKESLVILLAVEKWKAYLLPAKFIIHTDQRSLVHLQDQKLSTYWQQKAMTKLMGFQYKIIYKKGSTNCATDALSRMDHFVGTLAALSVALPTWLQTVQDSYDNNPDAQKLSSSLALQTPNGHYSLDQGIIKYKNAIWLGHSIDYQT